MEENLVETPVEAVEEEPVSELKHSSKKEDSEKKKKFIAAIIVIIILLAALGGSLMLISSPDWGGNDDVNNNPSYIGAIVPSEYIDSGTRSNSYYFVGYLENQTADQMQTFEISTSASFSEITGGKFNISSSGSSFVLDEVVSADIDDVDVNELDSIINSLFTNIEVSFTSLSLVYGNYTFGIGTTGTDDYIWVAPHESYPTFFNSVSVEGTVFDESALIAMAETYASSVFGDIDLGKIADLAQNFSFVFSGLASKFIIVNNLSYNNPQSISGDVIDTITPTDIDCLASAFCSDGAEWVKDVVGEIGEGIAIVAEADNTLDNTKLWFLLYSVDEFSSFPGICNIEVSKSDLSNLTNKVTGLLGNSFDLGLSFSFEINVGIILDVTPASYNIRSVTEVWDSVEAVHTNTLVESTEVEGYGIVIDLDTLIQSLGEAFSIPETTVDALRTLTTFKNPAFVLLLDEALPEVLNNDGTPAWNYATIAIIPDYDRMASGFRYLNLKGVLYDPATYFSCSADLAHIPIMVVDEYSEVTGDIQNVTIKDLKDGNVDLNSQGWAYVNLDAITFGTTLKTIAENVPPGEPLTNVITTAIQAFPLDFCVYDGLQFNSITDIYQIPIFYLATGQGPTYYSFNVTQVRGMYIDFAVSIDNVNGFLKNQSDFSSAETMNGLTDEISGMSNVTDPLTDFLDGVLDSGLIPPGFILAFEINDIQNTPTIISVLEPVPNATVNIDDFNIRIDCQDNPDMALWAEITIEKDGTNIFDILSLGWDIPIPAPILSNGIWDSENTWWWWLVQDYISLKGNGDYNITIRVHDFKGYSLEHFISVRISVAPIANVTGPVSNGTLDARPELSYEYSKGPVSIEFYYSNNGGTTWTYWGDDWGWNGWDNPWTPSSDLPSSGTYYWNARAMGYVNHEPVPTDASFIEAGPYVVSVSPYAEVLGPNTTLTNDPLPEIEYTHFNTNEVWFYWSDDGGTSWTKWGEETYSSFPPNPWDEPWTPDSPLPISGTYYWNARAMGTPNEPIPSTLADIESGPYIADIGLPWIPITSPVDETTGFPLFADYYRIDFSEPMLEQGTPVSNLPGVIWAWNGNQELRGTYNALNELTNYYADLDGAGFEDLAGNSLAGDRYVEFTTGDFTDPLSSVDSLSSTTSLITFTVTATASDASVIDAVELWYSKDSAAWQKYGDDTSAPWAWSFNSASTGGEGYYEFYSRAIDSYSNYELAPGSNDTWILVNNDPTPVVLNRPYNPTSAGDKIDISWSQYDNGNSDFASYDIYLSTSSGFTPGPATYIGKLTVLTSTAVTISGLTPQTQYHFIVRVNETGGQYANSNEVYSRTYATSDTGGGFASARTVNPGEAWSEDITAFLDSRDYYQIILFAGEYFWANMTGNAAGDPDLYLYNPSQTEIDSSESVGATESVYSYISTTGWYYVRVEVGIVGTNWNTVWFEVS